MKVRFETPDTREEQAAADAQAAANARAAVSELGLLDLHLDSVIERVTAYREIIARAEAGIARCLAEAAQIADARAGLARPESVSRSDARARERQLVATEIATATKQSERTVTTRINDSETLITRFPTTLAALDAGQITVQHARHLINHASSIPVEAQAAFEEQLLAVAVETTPYRFDDTARRLRETAHPESITTRTQSAVEKRTVFIEPTCDGMATLTAHLPAIHAIAIDDLIDKIARTSRTNPYGHLGRPGLPDPTTTTSTSTSTSTDPTTISTDPTISTDHRTHLQRRADAFTDLLLGPGNPAHPATITAQVIITAPATTITGNPNHPNTPPGLLHGYGPIDPTTTRTTAATAPTHLRVTTHPTTGEPTLTRHRKPPTPTNLTPTTPEPAEPPTPAPALTGRERYSAPNDLRLLLATLDETCRFPHCTRRANRCELDHTHDWAKGGTTTPNNLHHLCTKHHHLKHQTNWTITTHPNHPRHLTWTSPHGRQHTTKPPNPPPTG